MAGIKSPWKVHLFSTDDLPPYSYTLYTDILLKWHLFWLGIRENRCLLTRPQNKFLGTVKISRIALTSRFFDEITSNLCRGLPCNEMQLLGNLRPKIHMSITSKKIALCYKAH